MSDLLNVLLEVGEPVARDDGRYYVPVDRVTHHRGLSPTVLRVASDAFPDLQSAVDFAESVVEAYNLAREID